MNKFTYLLWLFIILCGFWDIKPIGGYFSANQYLILEILYLLWGWYYFRDRTKKKQPKKNPDLRPFYIIVAGMVLSMIPAYLFHHQPFVQSIISYRYQFLWFLIPLLFHIAPTIQDILRATTWLSVIMIVVYIVRAEYPDLFYVNEEELTQFDAEEGFGYLAGFTLATFPIFYHLQQLHQRVNLRSVFIIVLCFALIYLNQNRSTLFPITLIIMLSVLGIKSKIKPILVVLFGVLILFFFTQTELVWSSLFTQTYDELNNTDYNRNKALAYFLSPAANPSPLTYILGNGFLSAHSSSLMQDMMKLGIYNSDLGIIGFWNQFGLIPVIVFLGLYAYPLFYWRKSSWSLKIFALFMIATSLTIGYFGSTIHLIFFALYYYSFFQLKDSNSSKSVA